MIINLINAMEKNKLKTGTEAKGEVGVTSLPIKLYGD